MIFRVGLNNFVVLVPGTNAYYKDAHSKDKLIFIPHPYYGHFNC